MLLRCESLEPPMSQLGHERRFRDLRAHVRLPSKTCRESSAGQEGDITRARAVIKVTPDA